MTRVSPPELARAFPGPHASTSVTRAPRRRSSSAVQPPNAPAPTTTTRGPAGCAEPRAELSAETMAGSINDAFSKSRRVGTSKVKLHAQLDLARRERRRDRPKGGRRAVAVRRLKVRMVEQVE